MLRRDFRIAMDKARGENKRKHGGRGVCGILARNLDSLAWDLFQIFEPEIMAYSYWLCDYTSVNSHDGMDQLARRELFLDAFQGYMESTKLYKEL